MKWNWAGQLFKPNLLFISKSGVVWMDHHQHLYQIFKTTFEFGKFLEQSGQSTYPLRVFLDAVDHQYFFEKIPKDSFWQSHNVVLRQIENRFPSENYIFLDMHKDGSVSGFNITPQDFIQHWMAVLIELHIPVEGVYGLPYEIGRAATIPQLMIIPTSHQETRLIFSDGFNKRFCRFLPSSLQEVLEPQVLQTLKYICRENQIAMEDITVLSTFESAEIAPLVKNWQPLYLGKMCPEAFLYSYISLKGKTFRAQKPGCFQRTWQAYFLPRILKPLAVVLSMIFMGAAISLYYQANCYQQQMNHLQHNLKDLQKKLQSKNRPQLEHTFKLDQYRLKEFLDLREKRLKALLIFHKLMPLDHTSLKISQVILQHHFENKHPQIRLLIECVCMDTRLQMEESENVVKKYAQALKVQFPNAQVKIEGPPASEGYSTDNNGEGMPHTAIVQLDGLQP